MIAAIPRIARTLLPPLVAGLLALAPPAPAAAQDRANPIDRTDAVNDAFPGPISTGDEDLIRDRWFVEGVVNLPEERAGVLVQSQGRVWRRWHNEPITNWGGWILLGFPLLLFAFLVWRGRIPLRRGFSGRTILRFNLVERANHWMTASSFILMALTGLVILYGQHLVKPLIGAAAYSTVALWSAYVHMAFAVPLVIGVVVMAVLWTRRNLPSRVDWLWLKRGGGFLPRGPHHAPAHKFNAGQKLIFWSVVLGTLVLLATGLSLMFPFFWLDVVGMQWAQAIHAVAGVLMSAIIIGHIWIGTIAMVGAFDAMWGGRVDRNWAEEHHDLWVAELQGRISSDEARR